MSTVTVIDPTMTATREIEFRDALREAMTEEMRRDKRVFLLGEEVAQYDGAYKVSKGMLAEFGERRIIDTLEPVLNQHRLVVQPAVVRADYESTKGLPPEKQLAYMLFYQLTRVTKDRGSLRHDDRLDALSMAVGYWSKAVSVDVDNMIQARKDRDIAREMERFESAYSRSFGLPEAAAGLNWISKTHP